MSEGKWIISYKSLSWGPLRSSWTEDHLESALSSARSLMGRPDISGVHLRFVPDRVTATEIEERRVHGRRVSGLMAGLLEPVARRAVEIMASKPRRPYQRPAIVASRGLRMFAAMESYQVVNWVKCVVRGQR